MLEFIQVSAAYGQIPILENISLTIPKGQISTIIGPNGCGKSTLLQCLNGTAKVTAGSIRLEGKDFLALPPRERARNLAFLPQVRTVIPTLPVHTLVEHGRFPYLGFSRKMTKTDHQIVRDAMEFAGVGKYASQHVDTLSGGIRQRVFFAMILAQGCELLVLDEPTTYLDLEGQRHLLSLLLCLKEQGKTVLLVLHDLNQAIRISDRLIVMNDKKIAAAGTPKECLQQHVVEDIFHVTIKEFTDQNGSYYFFE